VTDAVAGAFSKFALIVSANLADSTPPPRLRCPSELYTSAIPSVSARSFIGQPFGAVSPSVFASSFQPREGLRFQCTDSKTASRTHSCRSSLSKTSTVSAEIQSKSTNGGVLPW
jgi:hypothetical protein